MYMKLAIHLDQITHRTSTPDDVDDNDGDVDNDDGSQVKWLCCLVLRPAPALFGLRAALHLSAANAQKSESGSLPY